jgi:RNA polymerase sigma-70 factor (ECF subfamily)
MSTDLITRLKNGDRQSQNELYLRYKDAIFTLCIRIIGDQQDAEDVLQMTFLEVFKSIKNFEERSSVYIWIRSIAVRQGYKLIQKKGKVFESLDNLQEESEVDTPSFENQEELQKAFDQLSAGYRTVLTLYYLEEMSHLEISEQLGITVGTSKSQLFHAKKRLKQQLER